jgi:hypothetical protein
MSLAGFVSVLLAYFLPSDPYNPKRLIIKLDL